MSATPISIAFEENVQGEKTQSEPMHILSELEEGNTNQDNSAPQNSTAGGKGTERFENPNPTNEVAKEVESLEVENPMTTIVTFAGLVNSQSFP